MAEEQADPRQRALRLAEAERERRNRLAQAATDELGEPASFMDKSAAAGRYATNLVNEVNRGILSYFPETIKRPLQQRLGIGVETEMSGTPMGRGAEYIGMALPMAVGIPAAGQATKSQMASLANPGTFRTLINDITGFAMKNPKLYFGGETAAAFGAGAAGAAAERAGAGPAGQLGSEVLGGLGLGTLATIGPRSMRAMREGIKANLLPMTEEGGTIRAARQMQARTPGEQAAQEYANRLGTIPEGVTPAQWIGDERLMAQEARLLRDNPELDRQVRGELQEARIAAQEALSDTFGRPRSRQDWERAVLERVTPDGATIEPGMTDEMLNQAYQSFAPLYNEAKGFPISIPDDVRSMTELLGTGQTGRFEPGLRKLLLDSASHASVMATDDSRTQVGRWLDNLYTSYKPRVKNGVVDSEDLLDLRSRIRDERRMQDRRQNQERADLLGSAEAAITEKLMEGLPESVSSTIRAADSQYRKYKIVENAIFSAGDTALTPGQLSSAIQQGGLTSQSRYARGTDEVTQELRRVALAGRSTEEILEDPRRAALFVRDLGEAEKRAVQADFVNVLLGRAKASARDATDGGVPLASGDRLIRDIAANDSVMRAIGMTGEDRARIRTMAETIQALEKKSPAAVDQLFEDGPASVLQLVAALAGAKSGQRMAGRGMGSSLVMAQFMSNKARNTLANLTSDQAEQLMADAVTDPELYKALLTKTIVARDIRQRAQYLESWLLASAYSNAKADNSNQIGREEFQ